MPFMFGQRFCIAIKNVLKESIVSSCPLLGWENSQRRKLTLDSSRRGKQHCQYWGTYSEVQIPLAYLGL